MNAPTPMQTMPHDAEAERSVLGAILEDPGALLHVVETLHGDEFYLESHRIIFNACVALQERGEAADVVTVTDYLREEEQLTRVGGASYLGTLTEVVPDVANVVHYAGIVRDKSVKRQLIGAAQKILTDCTADRGEAAAAVESAQRDVYKIAEDTLGGGLIPISRLAAKEIEAIKKASSSRSLLTGIDTGFSRLNQMTSGLQRKDLVILAARPSMGKTSLAVNICCHAALKKKFKVAIFSLEMSAEQLIRRMMSSEARINQSDLNKGQIAKSQWSNLTMTTQVLQEGSIWIDDTPGITVLELSAKARRLKQESGLDLVMVDYMQLMSGGGRFTSRNEEVSAISRGLKAVAKDLDVPMLVLSQLSRQPDRRGGDHRPQLSDLRESGSIEQDADVVMFIMRQAVYDREVENEKLAQLIIAKQRNGPTGDIDLVFQSEYTRFENLDTTHDDSTAPF